MVGGKWTKMRRGGGDNVLWVTNDVVGVVELVVVNCFNMRAEMGKGPLGARK